MEHAPQSQNEIDSLLDEFINNQLADNLTSTNQFMTITLIVAGCENRLEQLGYQVRVTSTGSWTAAVLAAFNTRGISLLGKLGHLWLTNDADLEIERNFLTGKTTINKEKKFLISYLHKNGGGQCNPSDQQNCGDKS